MPEPRVTTYAANKVVCTIGGQIIESGFAKGEFVSVEPDDDDWKKMVGADGEVVRTKVCGQTTTVKLKLLFTALGNSVLSTLRQADLDAANGAGVGVFELRDRNTGVVVAHADKSWIQKPPAGARGAEGHEMEWTLACGFTTLDLSGTPTT